MCHSPGCEQFEFKNIKHQFSSTKFSARPIKIQIGFIAEVDRSDSLYLQVYNVHI